MSGDDSGFKAELSITARLARLQVSEDELAALATDVETILGHARSLAEVDTEGVAPMSHATGVALRLREDQAESSLPSDVATGQAAEQQDGMFKVPAIIE